MDVVTKRYHILGVLGEGGFGRVYRARLEGPEGYVKEVAIKLMTVEDPPESMLRRFRDEARILGLVRDRAIVSADPPVRLGGHWAVVMEYVDGASLAGLTKGRTIPPRIAVEVVEEVARTLDNVWRHPGPNGQPLHLLHRDLKPGNVQVTPRGQVKLLDFGIAKATFDQREAMTTNSLGGTPGYIAPERLDGDDGPEGDVFSLGVVLHRVIVGEKPKGPFLGNEGAPSHVMDALALEAFALATRMRWMDKTKRPTARDVERRCAELLLKYPGESLRDWAERAVPAHPAAADDGLVGSVLTETLMMQQEVEGPIPGRSPRWSFAIVALLLFGGFVGAVAVAALVGTVAFWPRPEPVPVAPVVVTEPVAPPVPVVAPVAAVVAPPVVEKPTPKVEKPAPVVVPTGQVQVAGDGTVALVDGARRVAAPGAVPAGSYDVEVTFPGRDPFVADHVNLDANQTLTITCNARLANCRHQ